MFTSIRWHCHTIGVKWLVPWELVLLTRCPVTWAKVNWVEGRSLGLLLIPSWELKIIQIERHFWRWGIPFSPQVGYVSLSGGYISCLLWHRTSRKYLARILRAYKKNIRLDTIADEGIGKMHTSETLFNILLPAKSCARSAICKLCKCFSQ